MIAPEKKTTLTPREGEFSEIVLTQLTQTILGAANCFDSGPIIDQSSQRQLLILAQQDAGFANWLYSEHSNSHSTKSNINSHWSQCGEKGSSVDSLSLDQLSWETFLRSVIRLNQTSLVAELVKQAASLVLKLKTLQARYRADLEKSQRESIYHLAYGLSHELNNPLANIAARSGLLLSSCTVPDQKLMLETIIDNASRGSEMLGDLMMIARPPEPNFHRIDLNEFCQRVEEKGKFWSRQRDLKLEMSWPRDLTINSDASMMIESIWAVLRNAIEASSMGGTIRMRVSMESPILCVQIDDEGPGLSLEGLERCFDPYYSGREAGRGLGMGLTKAKRFAQILGGDVMIANLASGGCRAEIRIPIDQGSQ